MTSAPCYRNLHYIQWVRSLPCCVCNRPPKSEAAHLRKRQNGGTGIKPSDYRALPLCHDCHVDQHWRGEQAFWGLIEEAEKKVIALMMRYLGMKPMGTGMVQSLRERIEELELIIESRRTDGDKQRKESNDAN